MSTWSEFNLISERFEKLCASLGIEPEIASKKIGISNSTISKWKWDTGPSTESLIKISDFFGCSIDYLIGRNEHSEELNRLIDQLTVENQELVEQYAKLLALKQAHDEKNLKEAFDIIKQRITNFEIKYRFVSEFEKKKIERYISELTFLEDGSVLNSVDSPSNDMHGHMFLCFMSETRAWLDYCLLGKHTDFMQDINVFSAFSPFQLLIDADYSEFSEEQQVVEPSMFSNQCIYVDKDGNPVEVYLEETDN